MIFDIENLIRKSNFGHFGLKWNKSIWSTPFLSINLCNNLLQKWGHTNTCVECLTFFAKGFHFLKECKLSTCRLVSSTQWQEKVMKQIKLLLYFTVLLQFANGRKNQIFIIHINYPTLICKGAFIYDVIFLGR